MIILKRGTVPVRMWWLQVTAVLTCPRDGTQFRLEAGDPYDVADAQATTILARCPVCQMPVALTRPVPVVPGPPGAEPTGTTTRTKEAADGSR